MLVFSVAPHTDPYKAIKEVPIVQEAISYNHPEVGDTTILILKKSIWMDATMDCTLVNPNQLRAYGMTAQNNPFVKAPIFVATEDHEFMLPLSSKWTIIGVTTRTLTEKELQTCPRVTCLSAHEWDQQNIRFPKRLRTVEEETSRNIGAVMTKGGSPDLYGTDSEIYSADQIYDISDMTSQMIGSVKIILILSRNISEPKATVQDVPQAKTFQSKGSHSTVSVEELSEWWQIGIKQARETI